MKKILSLILATLMVLTAVAALAEAAPSKTAEDMAYVVKTVESNGGEGVEIRIVDPTELSDKILAAVLKALEENADVLALFDEETQKALAEKLPEGAEVELNELWPIDVFGYQKDVHADLISEISFPTVYTAEQTILAVIAHYNGEEIVASNILEGKLLEDGTVEFLFPVDTILSMLDDGTTMLYVLNTK